MPLPTPDQTAAPAEPPAKPLPVDTAKTMWYTGEDKDYIKKLWPLKEYTMDDFGLLREMSLMWYEDCVYVSMSSDSGKSFKELHADMKDYIHGYWTEDKGTASIESGLAELKTTDCTITENDTYRRVDFTFKLNGSYPEAANMLDSHWPEGVIDMPEELSGQPDAKFVGMTDRMLYMSREWDFWDYKDTFDVLREQFKGEAGYEYFPASEDTEEYFTFTRGDLTIEIDASDVYKCIDIMYIIYPDGFVVS
jgi:hypothetical protein